MKKCIVIGILLTGIAAVALGLAALFVYMRRQEQAEIQK